jgi:hypothetical protein
VSDSQITCVFKYRIVQTSYGLNRVTRTRTFIHPVSPKIHKFLVAKHLHSACLAEDVASASPDRVAFGVYPRVLVIILVFGNLFSYIIICKNPLSQPR